MERNVYSFNERDTENLASQIAPFLAAGDMVLLQGPVGAGKSHFARALIRSILDDHERTLDVPSPTYTLVQTYEADHVSVWHCDLYRLYDVDEIVELGLVEAMTDSIIIVEWPEKLGSMAPERYLRINIIPGQGADERRIELSTSGDHWQWVAEIGT